MFTTALISTAILLTAAPLSGAAEALSAPECEQQSTSSQSGRPSPEAILQQLTLKEKATLVVGSGWGSMMGKRFMSSDEIAVPGAAGTTRAIKRLGIPAIVLADGPAGVRIIPGKDGHFCTGFPVGTLLSCTWDTRTVEEVGKAMGNEALEYGVDVILAPGMNLMRNPLCGRNFEYYSEDPLLSGKTAAAMVRGIQSNGVGTSVKHFAANNQETKRMSNSSEVDDNTLRELYLKGFEIAIKEAQPWTVMSSYNKLNGVYTQEDHHLLTEILRDEWGYQGLVMTDWTMPRNAPKQIYAGNDLLEPGFNSQVRNIERAVKKGTLSMEDLDKAVLRVLEFICKTPRFNGYQYSNHPDLEAHAAVSRKAATEGMVLLQNNGALPLSASTASVALFGVGGYDLIAGGTGSGNVNKPYVVNLEDGLKNAGFQVNQTLSKQYKEYIGHKSNRRKGTVMIGTAGWKEMPVSEQVTALAAQADQAAVVVLSRQAGESKDRSLEDDFLLSGTELSLLERVSTAFRAQGKPVIVVLNVAGVIETASWKALADAILLAWTPGQEGGNAIADILTGKVNPSGRLAMTWPLTYESIPSAKNFPAGGKGCKEKTLYQEGLNVGYRYFGISGLGVSFPFGWGMSYTSFKESWMEGFVTVTNTGKRPGKHVVMHYDNNGILDAFAKTKMLEVGESQTICIFAEDKSAPLRVLKVDNSADSLILRTKCTDFSKEEINSEQYKELANKLIVTVTHPDNDGVGIAGPQVGISRRVVAVMRYDKEGRPFEVFPNIRITAVRGEKELGPEGCLSVPDCRGNVQRFRDIDITYTNPQTLTDTTETVKGYTAIIFQHECDHLDGILYTDRADEVYNR